MEELRRLWREAFGDTECYMDFYFKTKAGRSKIFTDHENQELASMAFFTPYQGFFRQEIQQVEYIVGVATAEKYRHRHRMKKLLERAIVDRQRDGIELVFLSPENPKVYESLGFIPVYDRVTTRAEGAGEKRFEVLLWRELSGRRKETISCWADRRLQEEGFELYLEHSPMYYDEVDRELQALGGELVTFWENDVPAAVCHVIREEEVPEVTELITIRERAEDTLLTLLYYLEQDAVNVADSYFISHVKKDWLSRIPQEKPMIMYRYTDGKQAEPVRD